MRWGSWAPGRMMLSTFTFYSVKAEWSLAENKIARSGSVFASRSWPTISYNMPFHCTRKALWVLQKDRTTFFVHHPTGCRRHGKQCSLLLFPAQVQDKSDELRSIAHVQLQGFELPFRRRPKNDFLEVLRWTLGSTLLDYKYSELNNYSVLNSFKFCNPHKSWNKQRLFFIVTSHLYSCAESTLLWPVIGQERSPIGYWGQVLDSKKLGQSVPTMTLLWIFRLDMPTSYQAHLQP